MTKSGKPAIAVVKLCLDFEGAVDSVRLIKSSGYADYDKRIVEGVRTWRYRPYTVDGRRAKACSAITFIYKPK